MSKSAKLYLQLRNEKLACLGSFPKEGKACFLCQTRLCQNNAENVSIVFLHYYFSLKTGENKEGPKLPKQRLDDQISDGGVEKTQFCQLCTVRSDLEIDKIAKNAQIWAKPSSEYIIRLQKNRFRFSPLFGEKSPFPQNR